MVLPPFPFPVEHTRLFLQLFPDSLGHFTLAHDGGDLVCPRLVHDVGVGADITMNGLAVPGEYAPFTTHPPASIVQYVPPVPRVLVYMPVRSLMRCMVGSPG